jgi:general secretion pathway protein N
MMRKRHFALAALGVVAYLVFLAVLMPASVLSDRLRLEGVVLDDVRGTLWNGGARATIRLPQGAVTVESLQWRFAPSRLATGRLAYDLDATLAGLSAKAQVARGFDGSELRNLEARGDARALAVFAPLAATWQPQGPVTVTAPLLSWDGTQLRGEARAEWKDAALVLSPVRPLGTYRAELRAAGGPAKLTLTTVDGALRLTGDGTLTAPGRFAFSGEARGSGPQAQALEPLLDLFGPRRADGARALRWSS